MNENLPIMSLRSPFSPCAVPEVALHRKFFEYFRDHGDKLALIDDTSGQQFTYSEVLDLVKRVACGLVKLGVRKQDVFAVYSLNTAQLVIMMWAVIATGATLSSVNPMYTSYEIHSQLIDSGTKYIYSSNEFLETAKTASHDVFPTQNIICSEGKDMVSFETLSQGDISEWTYLENMEFDPFEDTVVLFYSSGTTGNPKGVPVTHHNVLFNATQNSHPDVTGPVTDVCSIVLSPLYHSYAFIIFLCGYLGQGAKLIIQPKFEAERFLKAIEVHKVTHLYLLTSVMVQLAKSQLTEKYNLSSLEHAYSGGTKISPEVESTFCAKFGLDKTKLVYGMTEGLLLTVNVYNRIKEGSVGVLVPGLEGKVVDVTTGEELGPMQNGELCVKGPQITKGYLNIPEATQKAIDTEGWFHTGDIANYDEDNYIYILDRMADIFKVFDQQVSPSQLECLLFNHPSVLDVGVVGLPDEDAIHRPKAFVVKKPGSDVTEKELYDYVAGVSAKFKWLTGGVEFVRQIPKTTTGKILRKVLKEMA